EEGGDEVPELTDGEDCDEEDELPTTAVRRDQDGWKLEDGVCDLDEENEETDVGLTLSHEPLFRLASPSADFEHPSPSTLLVQTTDNTDTDAAIAGRDTSHSVRASSFSSSLAAPSSHTTHCYESDAFPALDAHADVDFASFLVMSSPRPSSGKDGAPSLSPASARMIYRRELSLATDGSSPMRSSPLKSRTLHLSPYFKPFEPRLGAAARGVA
ncbi:hypothetical protein HDU67_003868, partial [Dinochytrium kinnereticum]